MVNSCTVPDGCDLEVGCGRDLHLGAQFVEPETLREVGQADRCAIEQETILVLDDEKLVQYLPLGCEQRGVDRSPHGTIRHVIADEALEERPRLGSLDGDDGAVVEKGGK